MLKTSPLLQHPSVQTLLDIWLNRYQILTPDNSVPIDAAYLINTASPQGRHRTVSLLKKRLHLCCERATLQTNALLSGFESVDKHLHLADTRQLALALQSIFNTLFEIYQQQPSLPIHSDDYNLPPSAHPPSTQQHILPTATLKQLITALEPPLLELQNQHLACRATHTIGFLSTQFHFAAQILTERMSQPEQILLLPYFRFVEEQVCIPWQRVCAAAAQHPFASPTFEIIRTLLTQSQRIAQTTYQHSLTHHVHHHLSRRGRLDTPAVAASFLRDLNMFQAYFYLSVLEGDTNCLEAELLPLCRMVFPAISVNWSLVEDTVNTLVDQCLQQLTPHYQSWLLPHANLMKATFTKTRSDLHPTQPPPNSLPLAQLPTAYQNLTTETTVASSTQRNKSRPAWLTPFTADVYPNLYNL